jgi:hypothetical protein
VRRRASFAVVEEGEMDMDDDDEGVRVMAAICCCPSYCKSTLNRRAFVDDQSIDMTTRI